VVVVVEAMMMKIALVAVAVIAVFVLAVTRKAAKGQHQQ
jgi:hypothetical protein